MNITFSNKHLEARHFELPGEPEAPRVFISQLVLADFSDELRETITRLIDTIPDNKLDPDQLILAGPVFGQPSYETYQKLREESEYAAWVYVFGYRANHFTVSVNALEKFRDLAEVNAFLKANGFELNTSGGEIKGSAEQLLRQSSTLADKTEVEFTEGKFLIPSCYYEFAERFEDGRAGSSAALSPIRPIKSLKARITGSNPDLAIFPDHGQEHLELFGSLHGMGMSGGEDDGLPGGTGCWKSRR